MGNYLGGLLKIGNFPARLAQSATGGEISFERVGFGRSEVGAGGSGGPATS